MTRERLTWLLALLALAGCGWWLSANTEWVEVDSPRGAQGEARDNPIYAFEQLLRRLRMTVEHREALDPMPPEGARLVLLSSDWQLVPGRAEQLHQWVLRGGHLVVTQAEDWDDTALATWVPVARANVKRPDPPKAVAAASAAASAGDRRTELASTPPLWDTTPRLASCNFFPDFQTLRATQGQQAAWVLRLVKSTQTTQVLRLPIGQGSVTVLNASRHIFQNASALRCDEPLLLAAAVQAEPGATAWIYLNEKREALLPWLWHSGWIAIVAGLLALAAALWRAAVRFGPRLAPAPRLRRSITEQVRGLGAYLRREGREALLAAQQRALHETAARHLPRYARLPVAERVRAIAAATGLAAHDLASAMSARFCTRAELPQHLQLLEAARRRLHRTHDERQSP